MPSEELLEAMAAFNEELVTAGVMLDGAGLHRSSKGARVKFHGREAAPAVAVAEDVAVTGARWCPRSRDYACRNRTGQAG